MVWELAVEVEGAEEEALTESLLIGNLRERREREAKWRLEKEALGSGVSLRVEKKTLSILSENAMDDLVFFGFASLFLSLPVFPSLESEKVRKIEWRSTRIGESTLAATGLKERLSTQLLQPVNCFPILQLHFFFHFFYMFCVF